MEIREKVSDIKTFYGQQDEDYLEMWEILLGYRNSGNINEFTRKYDIYIISLRKYSGL